MSPVLNGSMALQYFECENAVEIPNRIMFDFYLGLPHVYLNLDPQFHSIFICFKPLQVTIDSYLMLGEQNAPNGVEQFEGGQNPPENHCGKKVLGSCVQVKFYIDKGIQSHC